ncbi:MAG: acyl-CoA thioesterase [Candidatus Omnitrophica bacterium]|nr:acyl-CoA thioesterase [Candidatus Omnitrophota bacterium]
MFTYKTQIRLHDTDAAGLIFFANQFKIIHDAYELLLEKFGFSFPQMLTGEKYFLPIVHAESDYKAPLFVGDKITIAIKVGHIGTSSFSFEYIIRNAKKALVGTAKTVHVTINPKTGKKTPLPFSLHQALKKYARNKGTRT